MIVTWKNTKNTQFELSCADFKMTDEGFEYADYRGGRHLILLDGVTSLVVHRGNERVFKWEAKDGPDKNL